MHSEQREVDGAEPLSERFPLGSIIKISALKFQFVAQYQELASNELQISEVKVVGYLPPENATDGRARLLAKLLTTDGEPIGKDIVVDPLTEIEQ